MSETIRAFFAIRLSPAVEEVITSVVQQLQPLLPEQAIRWTRLENLHVTLRFLQSVRLLDLPKLVDHVELSLRELNPFYLELTELELFPKPKHPRLIALKAEPNTHLALLSYRLSQVLDAIHYPTEKRAFRGHMTLGRFHKYQPPANLLEQIKLPQFPKQWVETIHLFQSKPGKGHSDYLLLKQFSLKKPSF